MKIFLELVVMDTSMHKAVDLKEWLADGKRYAGKGSTLGIKPVDLIYVGDIRYMNSSGTPIGL